jgi:hypothetical protein
MRVIIFLGVPEGFEPDGRKPGGGIIVVVGPSLAKHSHANSGAARKDDCPREFRKLQKTSHKPNHGVCIFGARDVHHPP